MAHTDVLTHAATKNGWSLVKIKCEWKGFGTKLIETYKYLKEHPEVTEFVFCDAYDVVVLGTPEEFKDKIGDKEMVVSCERGLWPPTLIPFRSLYEKTEDGFNYPNSGLYYAKSKFFMDLYELYPPFYEIDDQYWLNMCTILNPYLIFKDHGQIVFNSHSFISEGEYTYHDDTKRISINGSFPCFVHSNGRTVDEKFNELIKL